MGGATSALPPLDRDGYLRELADWSPEVATALAATEGIALTDTHWAVIEVLRAFYDRHEIAPNNRALVKAVGQALGAELGRSVTLMGLFGGSPALTAARIAGLPRPANCF
jgi:tRNA 2-thiouridine synthesizing protein E